MNTASIATVTMNPAVDLHTNATDVRAEIKIRCDRPRFDPGGGGINVSRAVKKLGGESIALHTAGGHAGSLLGELLERENIQHVVIPTQESTRENLTVTEMETEAQYRFTMPGAGLSEAERRTAMDRLEGLRPSPSYVVASGSPPPGVPETFYADLAATAKRLNARFVVDTSGQALKHAAEAGPFLLKPNRREIQALVDTDFDNTDAFCRSVSQLAERHEIEAVVVSAGPDGVVYASASDARFYPSPEVTVASKIGAGDSMVAGIVLGLARGMSVQEAVLFGMAAGASAVMTPGTQLCEKKTTERILQTLRSNWDK